MAIRDLLLAQAQQMGKALGKFLVDFLDLKSAGKMSVGIQQSNEELSRLLNIEIDDLLRLSVDELRSIVLDRKLTEGHLEILSEYFLEYGKYIQSTSGDPSAIIKRSIDFLDLADECSQTYSLRRQESKKSLLKLLGQDDNDSKIST